MKNFIKKYRLILAGAALFVVAEMIPAMASTMAARAVAGIAEESWMSPTTWGNDDRRDDLRAAVETSGNAMSFLTAVGALGLALVGGINAFSAHKAEKAEKAEEMVRTERVALLFALQQRVNEMEAAEAKDVEERTKRVALLFALEQRVNDLETSAGPVVPPQLPPSGASHPRKQQTVTAAT